jgi:hypothetical protein
MTSLQPKMKVIRAMVAMPGIATGGDDLPERQ